jgi:ABC-type phosphate/phosphonate transport system substrate-binding protein
MADKETEMKPDAKRSRFGAVVLAALCLGLAQRALWAAGKFVFTAPPRDSAAREKAIYEPVAAYLSRVTHKPFEFHDAGDWLTYQSEMQKGEYDLVFDGPAFVGWRVAKLGHVPLVKVPGQLSFVVIARKNDQSVIQLADLAGRTVCSFAPPNLTALTLLFQFNNPARQPVVTPVKGFRSAYDDVVNGRCVGGVLQSKLYEEFDRDAHAVKVLFHSAPMPNQAFTAGPRIDAALRDQITAALLSDDGKRATQAMRDEFKGQDFVRANPREYDGLGVLLRDVWGFGLDTPGAVAR